MYEKFGLMICVDTFVVVEDSDIWRRLDIRSRPMTSSSFLKFSLPSVKIEKTFLPFVSVVQHENFLSSNDIDRLRIFNLIELFINEIHREFSWIFSSLRILCSSFTHRSQRLPKKNRNLWRFTVYKLHFWERF